MLGQWLTSLRGLRAPVSLNELLAEVSRQLLRKEVVPPVVFESEHGAVVAAADDVDDTSPEPECDGERRVDFRHCVVVVGGGLPLTADEVEDDLGALG